VVWFGESLPEDALDRAWQLAESADVVLSVGTSTLVQPAASLPLLALERGAYVIEINPHRTPISEAVSHSVAAPAGCALRELQRAAEFA
jgi:NAD-dependent deacetylase